MTVYNWIVIAAWAVFLIVWLASSFFTKRTARRNMPWLGTALRILAALIILLFIHLGISGKIGLAFLAGAHPVLGAFGAAFTVIGIAFAVWARAYLGRNWGMPMTVREAPELVMTGPYAYVRHPIYTGVILAIFGSTLASGLPWLIVFIAASAYFAYSATKEEAHLLQEFPDAYPAYRARTKMLIPFIW